MPKQSLASIAKGVRTAMKKHSPEILTGIGIAGMITTTVMAVKATPKALILLEEKKDELDTDRLEPKDIVKTAWPCYIPAAVVGSISVFCLIGASSTKACVCGQRENEYGSPEDNFTAIAGFWSVYKGVEFTANDVAMMMALLKIARIRTGTATDDSYVDLAGYAACGAEINSKN